MCGRFDFHGEGSDVREISALLAPQAEPPPGLAAAANYNTAPTQVANVWMPAGLRALRFGWRRRDGGLLINARHDSLCRGVHATALAGRRALVLANGFYEWHGKGAAKTPYYFQLASGRPFCLAALWQREAGDAADGGGFVIVTTEPNSVVAPIHNRMPAIFELPKPAAAASQNRQGPLHPTSIAALQWLAEGMATAELTELLRPLPAAQLTCVPLSSYVSNVRNRGPQCIEPRT
jgi:putative SOS response-associated peptidase YedK